MLVVESWRGMFIGCSWNSNERGTRTTLRRKLVDNVRRFRFSGRTPVMFGTPELILEACQATGRGDSWRAGTSNDAICTHSHDSATAALRSGSEGDFTVIDG